MWSNLDNLIELIVIFHEFIVHVLVFTLCKSVNVQTEISVGLCYHQIEYWNHISGIVYNLAVQTLVKLENVIAVYFEYILVELPYFFQFGHVVALSDVLLVIFVVIVLSDFLKVVNEVFQLHLDIICVDVCPPDYLSVRTILSTCHVVQQGSV